MLQSTSLKIARLTVTKNRIINPLILIILSIFVNVSCVSFAGLAPPASAVESGPRTLILDGKKVSSEDVGGFVSWYCVDYIEEGSILLEVGYFGNDKLDGVGFILFDGGYTGQITMYERDGLDHRWDWEDGDYTFVIQPDGTGLYYDFSSVKPGTSTRARAVYKAYKR